MSGLAGTTALVRLILRRDRLLMALWILALGLVLSSFPASLRAVMPTALERQHYADNAGFVALYGLHLRGVWRALYVVSAGLALYFNVFVGVVQAFLKIPALHALAPQQTEAPFVAAQLFVLAVFAVLTVIAAKQFRGTAVAGA